MVGMGSLRAIDVQDGEQGIPKDGHADEIGTAHHIIRTRKCNSGSGYASRAVVDDLMSIVPKAVKW